jgi:penicillin-binding protein 1A
MAPVPKKKSRAKTKKAPSRRRSAPNPFRGLAEALEAGNIFKALVILTVWGFVAVACVLAYYAYEIPDILRKADLKRAPSITLEARDGTVFSRYGEFYGDPVSVGNLPPHLIHAFLAIEDRRFYDHSGIDLFGIARATYQNIAAGHTVQGGSTITQQLAKNLFLGPQRTLRRKLQEAMLSLWLEAKLSKDEILSAYLNRIYLGSGAYGVDAAARLYFNKSARQVTVREAAILAGLPRAPSRYSPLNDAAAAEARSRVVLQAMVDAGYLTPGQKTASVTQSPLTARRAGQPGEGRYFVDWVMEQMGDMLSETGEDVIIRTSLDINLQREAERDLESLLDKQGKDANVSQAALVSIGEDGAVRAMVGGREYNDSSFNRAVQAKRQPGSAFKPFVYLAALEQGMSPDDTLMDAPIRIGKWSPENFDNRYRGEVSMRDALAYSINTPTVRLAQKVGIGIILKTATALGITSPLRRDASVALGTSEVSLIDITSAYAVLAQNGHAVLPYGVEQIRTKSGTVIYKRARTPSLQIVSGDTVAALDSMMQSAVEYGTGRRAGLGGMPVAGKTGTTQDYRDAWFIGYADGLTTGVWMGNDDNAAMTRISGGTLPAQLWHDYMGRAVTVAEEKVPRAASYSRQQSSGFRQFLDDLFSGDVTVEPEYEEKRR